MMDTCKRTFRLLYICTHFTCQQGNVQNPSSQASIIREPRASRCTSWVRKGRGTRDQTAEVPWIIGKQQGNSRKPSTAAALTMLKPFTEWIATNWEILQEMEIQDHFTCLLRNLYADKEATVRIRHGIMDWFQIGSCILLPCLLNLYAEDIM